MLAIFLSLIGVFGGLVLSGAPFVIMMTMVGIIALAGIVVNNGVVLLDYAELLISRRKLQDGVSESEYLPLESLYETVVKAGKARLRPVLLTAGTTLLGNLIITLDPVFSGLAIAIIFGIISSTIFTLLVVPIVYSLVFDKSQNSNFNDELSVSDGLPTTNTNSKA